MDKPQFLYVTYIMTTPEALWNALMDGEMTKQIGDAPRMCPIGRSAQPGSTRTTTIPLWSRLSARS